MDFINGFLAALATIAAAHDNAQHKEAHFEQLQSNIDSADVELLRAASLAKLQAKHLRRSQQSGDGAKYYYAQKPQHWQRALDKVSLQPVSADYFMAELSQHCQVERPTTAQALSARFVQLLRQQLPSDTDWQFFQIKNSPFPLSFFHDDLVDASHEFIIAAAGAPVYYLGLGLTL